MKRTSKLGVYVENFTIGNFLWTFLGVCHLIFGQSFNIIFHKRHHPQGGTLPTCFTSCSSSLSSFYSTSSTSSQNLGVVPNLTGQWTHYYHYHYLPIHLLHHLLVLLVFLLHHVAHFLQNLCVRPNLTHYYHDRYHPAHLFHPISSSSVSSFYITLPTSSKTSLSYIELPQRCMHHIVG